MVGRMICTPYRGEYHCCISEVGSVDSERIAGSQRTSPNPAEHESRGHLSRYDVLATYESEIATKGGPVGAMVGTHAIIRSQFGSGRVICYSPHPEAPSGPNGFIARGITWAAWKLR